MEEQRYTVWLRDPHGTTSPLGAVHGQTVEEAEHVAGKLVRRRHKELAPAGLEEEAIVSLTNFREEEVGTPARVGEHLLRGS
jgi:hypothetical protein